jgi:hypothetical protein
MQSSSLTFVLLFAASFLSIAFLLQSYSNAEALVQPYMGMHIEGYQSSIVSGRTYDPVNTITGYTDFDGTSPAYLNPDLLSIVTTTGWTTSTNTISPVQYQFAIQAKNDGLIYSDPQVWKLTTQVWNCFSTNSCPVLGAHSQLNYVYYSMLWDSPRTQVTFYSEAHLTGNVVQTSLLTYTRNSSIDPSQDFSVGVTVNTNRYGGAIYLVKLLQVGVESDTDATNWKVHQWDVRYLPDGTPQRLLANDNVFVDYGGLSDADNDLNLGKGSDTTWDPSTNAPITIGHSTYVVNADYQNKPGSLKAAGDITWFPGTQLPYGTGLWGQRVVIVTDQSLGTGNNVGGMYMAVKDSANNIIRTGYTPFAVPLPTSGSYKIDHTNYGNYFFTKAVSAPSIVSDYNAVNWGGQSVFSLPSTNAYTVDAQFYNQGNPAGFARLTINSQVGVNGLTGMYVAISDPSSSTTWTKGFTSYTVGVPARTQPFCCDVTWTNYGAYYYQNADIVPNIETSDTKSLPWGGVQHLGTRTIGTIYIDTGNYNQCGSPC